ncbi:hypothetical protein KQI22_06915 [Kineothrix sp. MSJ-39]|uniref:hypothetical protein n=1 Tax=Kineothrix sp. MSJ-39 TaxID=2841533 RepID=UPI001C11D26A|nr:hypothetical protein [Kineothrix sp. MSJ-39]MBU5429796.1 hypothetical protein [Kineothrix sp. MSJ-39]
MFTQNRDYVYVYKGEQKLSEAGLRKLTVMERKVKVEFLLQDLPVVGGKGKCRLRYLLGGKEKEKSWEIPFVSGGGQMQFLQKLEEAGEIEGIADCRIFLPGGKEIRGEADAVTKEKQNVEEAAVKIQETKQKSEAEEQQIKKPESKSEVMPRNEELLSASQNESRIEGKESRKELEIPENQVLYIQDLTQLLSMGEKQRELYYNSFLLHGYYQYRHVVAGKGFIGVPGNFSQREAIAAKMMGFPLFIEAENLQNCEFGEETRTEMPQMGTYGYFLCKVG